MTANAYIHQADAVMASLGVEAYRVGGGVRDEILGRPAKDADYMVRGHSLADLFRVIKRQLPDSSVKPMTDRDGRPLGVRVTARGVKGALEITLPRKEISTGPGHRDFDIVLDPSLPLFEDAKRRDFTFNALYKAVSEDGTGIVADPTNTGLYDLQHRLVRTTYPTSFRDDPLRILRAARFVAVLGYDVSSDTLDQMREHASAVDGLKVKSVVNPQTGEVYTSETMSGTVLDEMNKLLMGDDAVKALRLLRDTGVLGTLFPELAPMIGFKQQSKYHDLTTDEHTFQALATAVKCEAPLRVRWSLLFHDSGKPESAWEGDDGRLHYYARKGKQIGVHEFEMETEDHEVASERLWREAAKRMNVPAKLRDQVATLIREHMLTCSGKVKASKVRRNRVRLGDDMLRDLHMHRMCDLSGKGRANRQHLVHVAKQEDIRRQAQAAGIPATKNDLEIRGQDALDLGMRGVWIGGALDVILDDVVSQPNETTLSREWQLEQLGRAARHRAGLDAAVERSEGA